MLFTLSCQVSFLLRGINNDVLARKTNTPLTSSKLNIITTKIVDDVPNCCLVMPLRHHRCLCVTHGNPIGSVLHRVVNGGFENETFPLWEEGVAFSSCFLDHVRETSADSSFFILTQSLRPITLHLDDVECFLFICDVHVTTEPAKGVRGEVVGSQKQWFCTPFPN